MEVEGGQGGGGGEDVREGRGAKKLFLKTQNKETGVFSESKAGRVGWGSGGISTAFASIRRILASS